MRKRNLLVTISGAAGALLVVAAAASAAEPVAEETYADFKQNCTSCHTIGGGPLAGPDLKNVTQRRTRDQLAKFIADPKAAIDAGDPYLVKLWNDARGVYMTPPAGLTAARIQKLLDLIDAESALEKSRFAGMTLSDRPLTPADVALGEALFHGTTAVKSGAPSCVSCHTLEGVGGFGGGRLGPDLTDVFARLGGRKPLSAWLTAPQSPTMTPVFAKTPLADDEILALVAYLQDRELRSGGRRAGGSGVFEFLAAGAGGLLGVLALFDFVWRRRFQAVRRPLVEGR
jgi:mono/diheme cytochrome c family protein